LHNDVAAPGSFHDSQDGTAYWAIRFYDSHGEDWLTSPIVAGATCNQVMKELYSLPNNVVPWASLRCTRASNIGANGVVQGSSAWNVENGNAGGNFNTGGSTAGSGSASDLGQDDGHGNIINGKPLNPNDDAFMDKIPGSGNDRTYFIRPNMAIWESAFGNNENGEWSDELWGLNTGLMTINAATGALNTRVVGYIYRIQF